MPSQSGADDRFEVGYLRAPAENLSSEIGIGNEHGRVTRSPRGIVTVDSPPAYGLGNPNHLSH